MFTALPPRLPDPAADVRAAGRLSVEGLELAWDPRCVDVAHDAEHIALLLGRARTDGAQGADRASTWLDRYKRRGDDAFAQAGGGFALAIVDVVRARVLLAVDRFAIETLCFRHDAAEVAFADAADAVAAANAPLDPQALFDYLYLHVIPAPRTAFRDVQRLRAAHRAVLSPAAVDLAAYWRPVFVEDDFADLAERERAFLAAVERCVDEEADEPATACFLSGGTDSSTVAGMLARLRRQSVDAYSIGFAADGYDEMHYAKVASRHFGLTHHAYYLTPDDLIEGMPRVAAHFDQPFGNSSVLPAYYCALRAREDGFTRLLAGDGGDELFGGNSRYATQKVFEAYHRLPAGLRSRVLEPMATQWSAFRRVPGLKQLGGYVRHSRHPMPERLGTFNLLDRLGRDALLHPALAATVDPERPLAEQRSVWHECEAPSLLNRMLAYDWKYTLADSDLPKVRCATQLAGVSVGYPFLGRALADLSLRVPPQWKLRGLALRWFFKRSLEGFLPREILRKKKHGFGLPFGVWVLRHPPLAAQVRAALEGCATRRVIRDEAVDMLWARLREAPGYYGEMVWILAMLEHWCRARDLSTR